MLCRLATNRAGIPSSKWMDRLTETLWPPSLPQRIDEAAVDRTEKG
jgi:hypothetical protein